MKSFAFDIYGTLINPMALGQELERIIGDQARSFNIMWRDKQLEFSFRKAAMRHFNHFSECTAQALDYCNLHFKTDLSQKQKSSLLAMYRRLPAFEETGQFLSAMKDAGHEVMAFSNGKKEDLISLFENADIIQYFDQIISVDEVRTFKPAPEVYELLADKSSSKKSDTWLVSANAFDIIGAAAVGLKTIWLKRAPDAIYDPFGIPFTRSVTNLMEIHND